MFFITSDIPSHFFFTNSVKESWKNLCQKISDLTCLTIFSLGIYYRNCTFWFDIPYYIFSGGFTTGFGFLDCWILGFSVENSWILGFNQQSNKPTSSVFYSRRKVWAISEKISTVGASYDKNSLLWFLAKFWWKIIFSKSDGFSIFLKNRKFFKISLIATNVSFGRTTLLSVMKESFVSITTNAN